MFLSFRHFQISINRFYTPLRVYQSVFKSSTVPTTWNDSKPVVIVMFTASLEFQTSCRLRSRRCTFRGTRRYTTKLSWRQMTTRRLGHLAYTRTWRFHYLERKCVYLSKPNILRSFRLVKLFSRHSIFTKTSSNVWVYRGHAAVECDSPRLSADISIWTSGGVRVWNGCRRVTVTTTIIAVSIGSELNGFSNSLSRRG